MLNKFLNGKNISAFAAGALALSAVVATPAFANAKDYRCGALAEQASAAADSADADKQKVAKRFVTIGNKLCEAGNGRDAAKQYRSALRSLGVAEAAPAE
ncbi:hypothetical protein [Sphingopyxis yananensis]|uniref:hypothetical protein n=1 Tax=Sphingopyxis yananensis TaxID=2886687 RepID=UPI001D0FF3E9|nr:hypothetical protein [Sphingopyxis yananensis]MCC2602968.1 hypothetical protein [Sphingopyxis yananensis]